MTEYSNLYYNALFPSLKCEKSELMRVSRSKLEKLSILTVRLTVRLVRTPLAVLPITSLSPYTKVVVIALVYSFPIF